MKQTIVASLVLALMLAGTLLLGRALKLETELFCAETDSLLRAAGEGRWEEADAQAEALMALWDSRQNAYAMVFDGQDLLNVEISLAQTTACVHHRSAAGTEAAGLVLLTRLRDLYRMEGASWQAVLCIVGARTSVLCLDNPPDI